MIGPLHIDIQCMLTNFLLVGSKNKMQCVAALKERDCDIPSAILIIHIAPFFYTTTSKNSLGQVDYPISSSLISYTDLKWEYIIAKNNPYSIYTKENNHPYNL